MPKFAITLLTFIMIAYFIIPHRSTSIIPRLPITQNEDLTSPPEVTTAPIPPKKTVSMPAEIVKKPAVEIETPIQLIPIEKLNSQTRVAIVNIYCTQAKNPQNIVGSGSGVVIDPNGTILTNAHVAQYFLLDVYNGRPFVNCVIRTGSPARNTYRAKLIYIPKIWVEENAQFINKQDVESRGEHDFALLKITDAINGGKLPEKLPFIPHGFRSVANGANALVTAYPAGFVGGATIIKNLYKTSAPVIVRGIYSFRNPPKFIDIIALGGSIVAQKGSSGGSVIDMETGELVGLIVTSSITSQTKDRMLNALTVEYINRELVAYTGENLFSYISNDHLNYDFDIEKRALFDEIK